MPSSPIRSLQPSLFPLPLPTPPQAGIALCDNWAKCQAVTYKALGLGAYSQPYIMLNGDPSGAKVDPLRGGDLIPSAVLYVKQSQLGNGTSTDSGGSGWTVSAIAGECCAALRMLCSAFGGCKAAVQVGWLTAARQPMRSKVACWKVRSLVLPARNGCRDSGGVRGGGVVPRLGGVVGGAAPAAQAADQREVLGEPARGSGQRRRRNGSQWAQRGQRAQHLGALNSGGHCCRVEQVGDGAACHGALLVAGLIWPPGCAALLYIPSSFMPSHRLEDEEGSAATQKLVAKMLAGAPNPTWADVIIPRSQIQFVLRGGRAVRLGGGSRCGHCRHHALRSAVFKSEAAHGSNTPPCKCT